jgi:hypothetical protein
VISSQTGVVGTEPSVGITGDENRAAKSSTSNECKDYTCGMTDQTIVMPGPIVYNFAPLGFWNYANHFLIVARLAPTDPFPPVPYFPYCHSIELALKAFLLHKGVTKTELKEKTGHSLERVTKPPQFDLRR